jgi:hypothetical protein
MIGQFPAAALIYRRGLVQPGSVLADISLNRASLLNLEGTPLPQDAAFDELRLKDVPAGTESKPGQRLDPLLHYAGRVNVTFSKGDETRRPASVRLSKEVSNLIDHSAKTVKSSTGELLLDYGNGVLLINAPQAQGLSGALQSAGRKETRDLVLSSEMDLGHIVVTALDGRPLSTSTRMLLQVMSEEKTSGFETEDAVAGVRRILNIGTDPWLVKRVQGTVSLKRADAVQLVVKALDFNGYPAGDCGSGKEIQLRPRTLHYLITGPGK